MNLRKENYYVYKTGLPFYDAACLLGAAHLFFGTASAEVRDHGPFWEIRGVSVQRNREQIIWVLERFDPENWEWNLFEKDQNQTQSASQSGGRIFCWDELQNFFASQNPSRAGRARQKLKAEYDAAVQIGTRGIDPMSKYEALATRSTGERMKHCRRPRPEVAAAALGKAFAARVTVSSNRQWEEIFILPVFRERFVISGFLEYERTFQHPGGAWVASVEGALSILLDLLTKRLPVVDFAYTREVKGPKGQPIFSSSGYLGLEKLCTYWWEEGIRRGNRLALELLRNFRLFLQRTADPSLHDQVKELARWVAGFVASPTVDALTRIEQIKARVIAASQVKVLRGADETRRLLGQPRLLKEVKSIMSNQLPEIPRQVSEALARALSFDEKGWMNQFTRLENAGNFSQFIQQVEHIISRGYYREQEKQAQDQDVRNALAATHGCADRLRDLESQLRDNHPFRAWKAIFLLDVLGRAHFEKVSQAENPGTKGEAVQEDMNLKTIEEG